MSDSQAAAAAAIAAAVRNFNTELWTLYAFGVLMTIFRSYARVKAVGFRDLQADDFLIWLAIVRLEGSWIGCHSLQPTLTTCNANPTPFLQLLYTTQSTLAYFAVNYGQGLANNGMTDAERAALSVHSEEYQLRYVLRDAEETASLLLTP